jgi:DNA-binding CsgD family transcriptional regulator/uncharacterized membrane-anchored protein
MTVGLAYGLLRCWCWFTFIEGSAEEVLASAFSTPLKTLAAVAVVVGMLSFLPEAFLLRNMTDRRSQRASLLTASAMCGTMIWLVVLFFLPHGPIWDKIGAASASVGLAYFTLVCGLACCEIGVRSAALAQCAASCFSILFMLPYLLTSTSVGAIYVFVLLPLASAFTFFAAGTFYLSPFASKGQESVKPAEERGWSSFGKTEWLNVARYAGLRLLINLCCGTLYGLLASMKSEAYNKFYNLSNVSYLVCSLLLGWILYRSPKMRFKTLCSVSVPLMAIGFIVFPLLESRAPFVCFFLIQAGFAFFNVYEWTYVLSIAERAGRDNVLTVLGCSMFLWWGTTWIGMALPERILSFLEAAVSEYPAILSAVPGICLWLAWCLTPDDMTGASEDILIDDAETVTACAGSYSFGLTKRETELLPWLVRGYSPAEIAKDLFLSESTIKTHLHNIIKKIGVKNKAELIERFRGIKK